MNFTLNLKRLQLALIHIAIAMTLVPLQSTLNRVMINELAISASLVAALVSLPYFFSPMQVFIGAFADRHPLWGWRRTPYIALGLLLCVVGVAASPYAAYALPTQPALGLMLCVLAFGAWGMGFNFATVSYFALASEISGEKGRSRTVAVMFFLMILSIIITAISLSRLLEDYSPETLTRAFGMVAGLALILGSLGLAGLEPRVPTPAGVAVEARASSGAQLRVVWGNPFARRFFIYLILMLAAILGQDILLEPFAAQAFGMAVKDTTRITAIWGTCLLLCLLVAGWLEGRVSKRRVAVVGAWGAVLAFALISVSGVLASRAVFYMGVVVLGLATGLATVSNLSLMLDMTTVKGMGMFMGAWGTADALARLVGNLLSGVLRDAVTLFTQNALAGYLVVFGLEALMLIVSLRLLRTIDVPAFQAHAAPAPSVVERLALTNEL